MGNPRGALDIGHGRLQVAHQGFVANAADIERNERTNRDDEAGGGGVECLGDAARDAAIAMREDLKKFITVV